MDDTARMRRTGFWAFTAVCVVAAAAYVLWRTGEGRRVEPSRPVVAVDVASPAAIAAVRAAPHLFFSSARGDRFMQVSAAPLDAPAGEVVTGLRCERAHFGREVGICLAENRERPQPRAHAHIVDRSLRTLHTLPLAGLPIRARVSRDGRYAAATVFVTGESYVSDFTTRTTLIDLAAGKPIADLEQFVTERDGRVFRQIDFNFWGVTFFADSNRFYATLGTGGGRYLVEGDIARRRMRVVRDNVECPSLSPDERRLVFKSRVPGTRSWRLHALDLTTMVEWPVSAAALEVDDQAEWLDDEHVLYAVHGAMGVPEKSLNVWISTVAPSATPESTIFLRAASSPAVVR